MWNSSRYVLGNIVEDLSTSAFLHAFRRFISLHGHPKIIISDNGTSFVGAQKEIRRLLRQDRRDLQDFAVKHRMQWKFITPLSPNQGGFYESLIKIVKKALQVVVGSHILTWNEMSTVFSEVKALLNARPISYSSEDPNDVRPLTPNHFLLGRASVDVPHRQFEQSKNLHRRLIFLQSLVEQTWKRLIKEYFPTLIARSKWRRAGRQICVGDLVLIVDNPKWKVENGTYTGGVSWR